jgi:hypothetical protein
VYFEGSPPAEEPWGIMPRGSPLFKMFPCSHGSISFLWNEKKVRQLKESCCTLGVVLVLVCSPEVREHLIDMSHALGRRTIFIQLTLIVLFFLVMHVDLILNFHLWVHLCTISTFFFVVSHSHPHLGFLSSLGGASQKLHMTRVTMSLLFKIIKQLKKYKLPKKWEQNLRRSHEYENLPYNFFLSG